jgi:hypothetical protein
MSAVLQFRSRQCPSWVAIQQFDRWTVEGYPVPQHLPLAKAIANARLLSDSLKIPERASRLGSRAALQHKKRPKISYFVVLT